MNRAQRRKQPHSKSNLRKSGLAYLTAAGLAGGSLGLVSPANAAALSLTADSCATINSELALLANNVDGGTLDISYVGTCALDAAYWMQGNATINGPTSGELTLEVVFGQDYGFGSGSVLNISRIDMTYIPSMGAPATFLITAAQGSNLTFVDMNFKDANLGRSAIYAEGNLTVSDSSFENLTSFYGGPAINNTSTALVINSTFSNNTADGQASGGAILAGGSLEITSSTFDSNQAGDQGGAIVSYAGARISNSTFVGNSAMSSAAVHLGEGGVISNSTFWNNGDADTFSIGAGGASPSYFFANILANDTPNTVKLIDPTQTTIDLGANLYTDSTFDNTTSGEEGSSELVTVAELNLSALASTNATSTPTVAIGADSVAYDYYTADSPGINPTSNGDFVDSLLASEDQRGADRPLSFGYDVGAYESGEKPEPTPSETPEITEIADSESLADTGLETSTNYLGLIGVGLAAILGGSVGLIKRRRKV